MSDKSKARIEFIGLCLAVLMSLGSVIAYFAVIPYKLTASEQRSAAMERRIDDLARQRSDDHELLTRIEERLIAVQKELNRRN